MIIEATQTEREQQIWQFAVELYGEPRVADCCILLQDQCAVDVIHLLFLLFLLGADGFRADRDFVTRSRHVCTEWRDRVVIPLRQLRRDMKPMESGAIEGAAQLRHQIKALELQAERLQLNYLLHWSVDRYKKPSPPLAPLAREATWLLKELVDGTHENAAAGDDAEETINAVALIAAAFVALQDAHSGTKP